MPQPRQSLHGRLAGTVRQVIELTNIQNDFAAQYDEEETYGIGDYVMKKDILYKAKVDGITGEWDVTKWDKVSVTDELSSISVAGKFNSLAVAPAYNPASTYSTGDLISRNDNLYKANKDISMAKPFDAADWDSTDIADELDSVIDIIDDECNDTDKTWSAHKLDGHLGNITMDIAKSFHSTSSYNIGDYVIKGDKLYRAKVDIPAGAWDASKWDYASISELADDRAIQKSIVSNVWSSSTQYAQGNLVMRKGRLYKAITTPTIGEFKSNEWNLTNIYTELSGQSGGSSPYTFIIDSDSTLAEFLTGDTSAGQNYADVYIKDGEYGYSGNISIDSSSKHICGNKATLNINSPTLHHAFHTLNIEDLNFIFTNASGAFSQEVEGIFFNCWCRNVNIAITGFADFNYSETKFSVYHSGRADTVFVLVGDGMESATNMNTKFIVFDNVDTVIHGGVHENLYNAATTNNLKIMHYNECYIVESNSSIIGASTKQHNIVARSIYNNCCRVINNKVESSDNANFIGINFDSNGYEEGLIASNNYIRHFTNNDSIAASASNISTAGIQTSGVNVEIVNNNIILSGRNQSGIRITQSNNNICNNLITVGRVNDSETETVSYCGINILNATNSTQNINGNTITLQYSTCTTDTIKGIACNNAAYGSLLNNNIIKLKNLHASSVVLSNPVYYIDTCTCASNNIFVKTDITGDIKNCTHAFNNFEI